MHRRSDGSLAALLLTQRLVDTDATPLKAGEFWSVLEAVPDPATFLPMAPAAIGSAVARDEEFGARVRVLLDVAAAFATALDAIEQSGIHAVSPLDDAYPTQFSDRLGRSAPPSLYACGDLSLLGQDALGIVGSRDVGEVAADVTVRGARAAVAAGWGVVSGGAKGVDRLAMNAAIEAGGWVVGVLADSLARTIRDGGVQRAVADGQLCLLSPYKPTAGFSVANAMGRNKLIYALSAGTLVVTSAVEKGGTWAGAIEAIRQHIAPVVVWTGDGAGPGNGLLVERGGIPVSSPDDIIPVAASGSSQRARQLGLEL